MRFFLGSMVAAGMLAILPSSFTNENSTWVGSWACSPQLVEPQNRPPEPGLADSTLRQVGPVTLGGGEMRLRFSSDFGAPPLVLDPVRSALRPPGPGSIRPDSARAVP